MDKKNLRLSKMTDSKSKADARYRLECISILFNFGPPEHSTAPMCTILFIHSRCRLAHAHRDGRKDRSSV